MPRARPFKELVFAQCRSLMLLLLGARIYKNGLGCYYSKFCCDAQVTMSRQQRGFSSLKMSIPDKKTYWKVTLKNTTVRRNGIETLCAITNSGRYLQRSCEFHRYC